MAYNKKHKKSSGTWEIERLDPKKTPLFARKLVLEHTERYNLGAKYCKEKIVVDMGCGSGYGSNILANNGAKKVYALDIDENTIEYAKKNYQHPSIEYRVARAENTSLADHSVDVIITFETIEHVTDVKKMLQEIQRILRPGGTLILSTPNKETSFGDNPFHVKEYTLSELDSLLSNFPNRKYYGQRKVNRQIIRLYKELYKILPFAFLRFFLKFRPWESHKIYPLKHKTRQPYLYLIAICQQKNIQK